MRRFAAAMILAAATMAMAQQATQPQLTDVERLTLENLQLKATLMQQEQQTLQQQFQATVAKIASEHPGYQFDPTTGQFTPLPKADAKPEKK